MALSACVRASRSRQCLLWPQSPGNWEDLHKTSDNWPSWSSLQVESQGETKIRTRSVQGSLLLGLTSCIFRLYILTTYRWHSKSYQIEGNKWMTKTKTKKLIGTKYITKIYIKSIWSDQTLNWQQLLQQHHPLWFKGVAYTDPTATCENRWRCDLFKFIRLKKCFL